MMIFQKFLNNKTTKSVITKLLSVFMMLFIAVTLFSNIQVQAQGIKVFDILNVGCLFEGQTTAGGEVCGNENLLARLINFLTILAVPLAIFVIIWGGYQYFIGGFDGKSNGKAAITAAITGLLIVTFARFLVDSIIGNGSGNGILGSDGSFNAEPAIAFIRALALSLTQLAGAIAVIVIMWGGYKYFFSGLGGKEDGLKSIQNGIIGMIIVLLTYSAFDTIANVSTGLVGGGNPIDNLTQNLIIPFVTNLKDVLFTLATTFATVVLIIGGYKYFFNAAGAKEDGLKSIRNGIIGLITVFLASFIVDTISGTLGATPEQGQSFGFEKAPIISFLQVLVGGILLPVSSAVAVFFIVLAGFYYTTSGGDPKKAEKGQAALQNSIIGLLIILLASTIIAFIRFILGAGISF